MTAARTAIQDFATANEIYANATVTAYTVDGSGNKTSTKATLYSAMSGAGTIANPQTLDAYGKFRQPVYIEDAVILTVTGLGNTPDHDTGVVAATAAAGSVSELLSVDVVISSAELLALHSTPKTLVAAPGAGKALSFEGAFFFLDYNSAAYAAIAAGDDLDIRHVDASGPIVGTLESTGFLDQTADKYAQIYPNAAYLSQVANSPLVATLGGAITTGNSPLAVRVFYRIVNLATLLTA